MPAVAKNRPLARGDACQHCKARKVRCPAQRPACANCIKRKQDCVYTSSPAESSASVPIDVTTDYGTVPVTTTPGYGLDSSWMSDLGMLGLFPFTTGQGNEQSVPSLWTQPDLDMLMQSEAVSPSYMAKENMELTDAERDHLLLLYFTSSRIFGFDMHIATFYNKLQSGDPLERPHACLLNAMYLMTCRASPVESLRAKEQLFYTRARAEMDKAVGQIHGLFDAMRTGTMITCYLFALQRHAEGWAMLGQTVHIAIACGVDRIAGSNEVALWELQKAAQTRGFTGLIANARSNLEVADRIYAFWALFLVDRCASIAFEWPAGFDMDAITTPLPRPWVEYETNDPHLATCDTHIWELFEPADSDSPPSCQIDHLTELGHHLGAVALMYKASCRPVKSEQEFLLDCLVRYKSNLPDSLKQPQTSADGKVSVTGATAALQIITICTEMFLYSVDAMTAPDPRALDAARRVLGVMHLLDDANVGDINLFIIILWCRVGRVLIWESKRLTATGDSFAAATYAKDVDYLTSFLEQLSHYPLAMEALGEVRAWWTDPLEAFEQVNHTRRNRSRYTCGGDNTDRETKHRQSGAS